MYCPRCGHQPISDSLRFCSYCGFKLGVVKASLADEEESSADSFAIQVIPKEPRQRDINIGVILMFAGALLATLMAGFGGLGREGGALILAISFAIIILLSRPLLKVIYNLLSWESLPAQSVSSNRRGMLFGSTLMFASTILLVVTSLLMFGRMRTQEFLMGLVVTFFLLLVVSKYLMRAIRYLVAGEMVLPQTGVAHDQDAVGSAGSGSSIAAGQSVPVSLFTAQRVNTAEMLPPASVTEQTTNLLEKK